jgi:hypothetical protein
VVNCLQHRAALLSDSNLRGHICGRVDAAGSTDVVVDPDAIDVSPGRLDPACDSWPAEDKSTKRIDAIVATIMAFGRAMVAQERAPARVLAALCLKAAGRKLHPLASP